MISCSTGSHRNSTLCLKKQDTGLLIITLINLIDLKDFFPTDSSENCVGLQL